MILFIHLFFLNVVRGNNGFTSVCTVLSFEDCFDGGGSSCVLATIYLLPECIARKMCLSLCEVAGSPHSGHHGQWEEKGTNSSDTSPSAEIIHANKPDQTRSDRGWRERLTGRGVICMVMPAAQQQQHTAVIGPVRISAGPTSYSVFRFALQRLDYATWPLHHL